MTEPERLLLIFERSPEESRLTGVDEAIRALGRDDIKVEAAARNPGVDSHSLIERVLRFWFPYLWSAGITGVTPGAASGSPDEAGEFVVTLAPMPGPTFGTALGAWLGARHGRKVRLKVDDVEIEARTPERAETLLARLEALRRGREAAPAINP